MGMQRTRTRQATHLVLGALLMFAWLGAALSRHVYHNIKHAMLLHVHVS
jgi:hypothetical protein